MDEHNDLAADLCELIDAELVAVTGKPPNQRYCLTPLGMRQLAAHRDQPSKRVPWVLTPKGVEALAESRPGFPHEQAIRTEARELAERRHAATRRSNVVDLFGEQRA